MRPERRKPPALADRTRILFPDDEELLALTSAQGSAGEEDDPQQDMNDVIHFAKHQQRAGARNIEHMFRAHPQEPAADAQQKIDKAKHQTEPAGAAV